MPTALSIFAALLALCCGFVVFLDASVWQNVLLLHVPPQRQSVVFLVSFSHDKDVVLKQY